MVNLFPEPQRIQGGYMIRLENVYKDYLLGKKTM